MALVAHKYMPEQMSEEELRRTFAAREHTLEYLVKALREQITARTLTSYLITGPRGSGKTTVVLMLCLRLREDPDLRAAWLPVRLPEELPAITSLRDLLAAVLQVLADDGVEGAREWHQRVDEEEDERRSQDLAVAALRRIAERRSQRLVLFVENLDQCFERALDERSQATLRRLLMVDPFMVVVATAVQHLDALRAYSKPFFNYFCEVPLLRLDDEQVGALLTRRAEWDGRPDVERRYREQRPTVQAISRLTGDNPRLVMMLYEVLSHGDLKSVVDTLRQLVDELTPLLKDVLEHRLSDQQRRIVDALMRAGGTATPSDLASAARLPLNNVTTQLRRLKEAQFLEVHGGGKGRPAYYSVPDQLFCTWYQLRYLRPHRRRIEMFVEVLRLWFDAEERLATMTLLASGTGQSRGPAVNMALTLEYFAASLAGTPWDRLASDLAVRRWLQAGDVREAALALMEFETGHATGPLADEATAYARLGDWARDHGDPGTALDASRLALDRDPHDPERRLAYGEACLQSGDLGTAVNCFGQVIVTTEAPALKARALVNRGVARAYQGDHTAAIADYTTVVGLAGAPADQVGRALVNRGATRGQQGDIVGAVADCTAVVELVGAPADQVARALFNRGVAHGDQRDIAAEIADYTAVVDLAGAPAALVASALVNRGLVRHSQGDVAGAIADYTAVVDLAEAPADQVARALYVRGLTRGQQGNVAGAIADYTAVVDLAGTPADQVARALINRAATRGRQGDISGELADYTAVVDLTGAPADQVARALFSRGVTFGQQGDIAAELADYTAVVDLAGAPADQVARALINRAATRGRQGDISGELADYTAVVDLSGAPADQVAHALINRGATRGRQGDIAGAIADCTAVVELTGAPPEHMAVALVNRGVAHGQWKNAPAEIGDYTAVVELAGAPVEQVARALFNRGVTFGQQGDIAAELADYTTVVDLAGAPTDQVAQALVNRGATLGQQGDLAGAIADCSAAVELVGAPPEQVALALVNRGAVRGQQGDVAGAIADYTAILSSAGVGVEARSTALLGRGAARARLGETTEAVEDWLVVVGDPEAESSWRCRAAVAALRVSKGDERLQARLLQAVLRLVEKGGPEDRMRLIVELLHGLASPHMRGTWPRIWRALAGTEDSPADARLAALGAVAEILEHGDLSRLDPLPPEQREFAREILRKFDPPSARDLEDGEAQEERGRGPEVRRIV